MLRSIRSILLWLALSIFFSCAALAESGTGFAFPGGITWDQGVDEVEALLGEPCERVEDDEDSLLTATLMASGREYFGAACLHVQFGYVRDTLCDIACIYPIDAFTDDAALIDALTGLYGAPGEVAENAFQEGLIEVFEGAELTETWALADGTEIYALRFPDNAEYGTAVCFFNRAALTEEFE